jgi:hypothetical protein
MYHPKGIVRHLAAVPAEVAAAGSTDWGEASRPRPGPGMAVNEGSGTAMSDPR